MSQLTEFYHKIQEQDLMSKEDQLQRAKHKALQYAQEAYYHALKPRPCQSSEIKPDYAEIQHQLGIAYQYFHEAYVYDQMLLALGKPSPAFELRQYPDYLSNIRMQQNILRLQIEQKNALRDQQNRETSEQKVKSLFNQYRKSTKQNVERSLNVNEVQVEKAECPAR